MVTDPYHRPKKSVGESEQRRDRQTACSTQSVHQLFRAMWLVKRGEPKIASLSSKISSAADPQKCYSIPGAGPTARDRHVVVHGSLANDVQLTLEAFGPIYGGEDPVLHWAQLSHPKVLYGQDLHLRRLRREQPRQWLLAIWHRAWGRARSFFFRFQRKKWWPLISQGVANGGCIPRESTNATA